MTDRVIVGKIPIRGWLIVIGIMVWVAPFAYGFVSLAWAVTAIAGHLSTVEVYRLLEWTARFLYSIWLLRLFLMRKSSFVKWVLIYEAFQVVELVVQLLMNIATHPGKIGYSVLGIVEWIVLVLYLLRSKRVKETFTR